MTFFTVIPAPPAPPNPIVFGWPEPEPAVNNRMFNAVHMSLIPKGLNRGKVLVWDVSPVLAHVPGLPAPAAGLYHAFQAYAIIDMVATPPQFQNFLLPLDWVAPIGGVSGYPPYFPQNRLAVRRGR